MNTRTATTTTGEPRAWQFLALGAPTGTVGIDAAGRVALVAGDAAIRQSLVMLLSTTPGERLMRPDYGCPLDRLVFQSLDRTTAGLAIHYVEQAVRRFEPRVDVVRVTAVPSAVTDGALAISLDYRTRLTRRTDRVDVTVAVDPEASR